MSTERQERLEWAHDLIAGKMDEIKQAIPKLPKQTCIIRDPDKPERHILVTNESDEVAHALERIVRVEAK